MRRETLTLPVKPLVVLLAAIFVGALGLWSPAQAVPMPTDLILDPGPLNDYCGNPAIGCYGAIATNGSNPAIHDVIGAKNDFDVRSIQFTEWTNSRIQGDIRFNYHTKRQYAGRLDAVRDQSATSGGPPVYGGRSEIRSRPQGS